MILPFRITICGLDELAAHRNERVTHVLSILDPGWPVPEIFGQYGEHQKLELRFDDIIESVRGQVAPSAADVDRLLTFGRTIETASPGPAHCLVHCHAGISRSSASMALLLAQALPERSGAAIFADILAIRPQIWPNLRIVEFGDTALARHGDLIQAAHEIYRSQAKRNPDFAETLRAEGRTREVEIARTASPSQASART